VVQREFHLVRRDRFSAPRMCMWRYDTFPAISALKAQFARCDLVGNPVTNGPMRAPA